MNSRCGIMVLALVWLAGVAAVRGAPATDDGPASFDCGKDRGPLAVTVCNDRAAAAAERRTTTSYFALYFQLPEGSRSAFRTDHLQWLQGVTARCPPKQSTADQLALPAQCVRQLYSQRADLYRKKLSGAALEEAGLSPALLKKLQKRLVDLKFLSGTPDGMFGADTRAAIKNYQASIGHPQDNFLSAQERTTLLETTTVACLDNRRSVRGKQPLLRPVSCNQAFRIRKTPTNRSSLGPTGLTVRSGKPINRMRRTLPALPRSRTPPGPLMRVGAFNNSISSQVRCLQWSF